MRRASIITVQASSKTAMEDCLVPVLRDNLTVNGTLMVRVKVLSQDAIANIETSWGQLGNNLWSQRFRQPRR